MLINVFQCGNFAARDVALDCFSWFVPWTFIFNTRRRQALLHEFPKIGKLLDRFSIVNLNFKFNVQKLNHLVIITFEYWFAKVGIDFVRIGFYWIYGKQPNKIGFSIITFLIIGYKKQKCSNTLCMEVHFDFSIFIFVK